MTVGYAGNILPAAAGFGTGGTASLAQTVREKNDADDFRALVEHMQRAADTRTSVPETVSSSQITPDGRLPGDFISSMSSSDHSPADRSSPPTGAAANSGAVTPEHAKKQSIDRTSALYEKSLELESYFVKIMLSSMRSTVMKSGLTGESNSYAREMYEDMMYDELAVSMTKNAGFGLADQVYLQLSGQK